MMPPGLYEAVIEDIDKNIAHPELVTGKYLFRLERRKLDDIRALGENSPADEVAFATAARVSDINKRLYERFARPLVRSLASEQSADAARSMHPNRLRFEAFSSKNPAMRMVADAAKKARDNRTEMKSDNPFLAAEKSLSTLISSSLDHFAKAKNSWTEQAFFLTYGSPFLQALTGESQETVARARQIEREGSRHAAEKVRRAALEQRFDQGGLTEATLRAIAYIKPGDDGVDERSFAALSALRSELTGRRQRTSAELQDALEEQTELLRMDEKRALATLPKLLPDGAVAKGKALDAIRRLVTAQGPLSSERRRRLTRIEKAFTVKSRKASAKPRNPA